MIGVIANASEAAVVREFFELFKTPWEFYDCKRKYDVILCSGVAHFSESDAKLVVIYSGRKLPMDDAERVQTVNKGSHACALPYKGFRIPVYGDHLLFRENSGSSLVDDAVEPSVYLRQSGGQEVVRIGYDLFAEVRTLLTRGQPIASAAIPTLELHIALLRDLIVAAGITVAEIPPVPDGYRFIACLTHDVDHPMIRRHKFDHTMFGFLYRALWGSLIAAFRGRVPWRNVGKNWIAALKLPLVDLGLAKDYWDGIDHYVAIEGEARSSFFIIPYAGRPGRSRMGTVPNARAAAYGAADISKQIRTLRSVGCEIGLHGIDAWTDTMSARDELDEIRRITGTREIGVRMHWLYFDEHAPQILERGGASYDSSVGYNETIGYRAGTTQAYNLLGTSHLIELPLHVMDTALFFPTHLNLSSEEARKRVGQMIDYSVHLGGCLTVNWHDRSIAPERLWGNFYADLVAELKARGAWLTTAGEAVAWFRQRRAAAFEDVGAKNTSIPATVAMETDTELPGLQLLVHVGQDHSRNISSGAAPTQGTGNLDGEEKVSSSAGVEHQLETAADRS